MSSISTRDSTPLEGLLPAHCRLSEHSISQKRNQDLTTLPTVATQTHRSNPTERVILFVGCSSSAPDINNLEKQNHPTHCLFTPTPSKPPKVFFTFYFPESPVLVPTLSIPPLKPHCISLNTENFITTIVSNGLFGVCFLFLYLFSPSPERCFLCPPVATGLSLC